MATKAKAGDKVNLKEWKDLDSLMIVDVSAHMRTNDAGDLKENTEAEDLMYNRKPKRFERKVLSTEINGEEMVVTSLFRLMNLFQQYGTHHTWVFTFDIGKSFRKDISKKYKSNRVKMGDYYYTQVNTAYKILEEAGFTVLSRNMMEADDCIVEAVKQNYDYYDKIGIMTNDHDMTHLIDDEKVSWINVKKTYADIHMDNYFQQNKCPYNAILLKKAMVGDPSDKIQGIHRFGEKSFIKFLDKEGIYGEDVRGQELDILSKSEHITEDQRVQALESWKLVEPKRIDIDATANDIVQWGILEAFFKEYKFNSLLKMFDKIDV